MLRTGVGTIGLLWSFPLIVLGCCIAATTGIHSYRSSSSIDVSGEPAPGTFRAKAKSTDEHARTHATTGELSGIAHSR
jgi:hypothetical protein